MTGFHAVNRNVDYANTDLMDFTAFLPTSPWRMLPAVFSGG
jgi:hypothetical protein